MVDEELPSTKRRKVANLLEEQEDLVNWYEVNEIFYNQNLRKFKNTGKKEKMMLEKAKELFQLLVLWNE